MLFVWAIYFSIGLYILMPGLVVGWSMPEHPIVKVLGSLVAITFWPLLFLARK